MANEYTQRPAEKRLHGAVEKDEKNWFVSSPKSELGSNGRGNERGSKDSLWNLRIGIHLPGNGKTLRGKIMGPYLGKKPTLSVPVLLSTFYFMKNKDFFPKYVIMLNTLCL